MWPASCWLRCSSIAASVVLLPAPVAPTIRMSPRFSSTIVFSVGGTFRLSSVWIRIGELAERKTSDAPFSDISRSTRSMFPPLMGILSAMVEETRSVAQQIVDAGLGARLRVDTLHDHGAIKAVGAAGLGQVAAD